MIKTIRRFGVAGLIVSLLIADGLSAAAQGLLQRRTLGSRVARPAACAVQGREACSARQNEATKTEFYFKDICFRSLLGINDEVLADSDRFPCAQDWVPPIELGERFGGFTNATMTVTKDRNTGKLALSDVKFIKVLGPEADDKALLKEYEHAVDLVSKLLGVSVACPGLVDSEVYLGRRYFNSIDRRIKSRTLLNLAKGQRVEVEATEASYAIRAGQPIQITAPIVEIEFTYGGSLRTQRSSGQDFESVRELTLGMDCSDLLSMKMRVQQEQSKLRELERTVQRQQLAAIQEELKRVREAKAAAAKSDCAVNSSTNKPSSEKISVAEKLSQCDFLLNKDFKKDAKFYLCLFSASWCPPCRAEMPRIAKTYAETLKDDPDIELVHFSRDQNDDKANAWAKEHDVKFPVVKPRGGNPLDLHCNGIPHLFIVKADGTLLEEGHPMRIFNEEKFREIKSGNMKPRTADADLKSGERTEQVDGYTWTYRVENGEATIVAAGGKRRCTISPSPKGNLTIPSKLGGINVTKIGSEAFCECSGITSVTFPASLKEICWRAFSECGSLSSVTIPAGVAKIYPSAFSGCKSLKTITVSDENAQYASRDGILFDKGVKTLVCYPGGISGEYAVPSGVTRIGGNAFSGCSGLTSVTVSDDVTQIGEWAFSRCRGLNSVKIGRGVTRIAQGSFYRCSGLTSVSVDAGNERYSSRDGVLFDKGMKTLICCPSGISGEYVIPSSVTSIEIYAFDSCRKLTSVTIPDGVTSIAQSVFCYSDQLTVVSVPGSVERIGDWAFSDCRGLDTVKISNGVTSIGTGMFCGCFKLTSMTIPSSVKSIKKYAFSGCRELTSVTMQGERPEVEADAFESCDKLKAIHVPANAKSWAGMKEWQGIPLVFDAETEK